MLNKDEFLKAWLNHRKILQELVQTISDEQLNFKPWDGAMTFGSMALHLATSGLMFVKMVRTEAFEFPNNPEFNTVQELSSLIEDYTNQTKGFIEELTDDELQKPNEAEHPKLQGKKFNYLQAMLEHEIHHKGQLFIYARMCGIEKLPFFR